MSEELLTQFGGKVDSVLTILGEKLGQGADFVWPILVRQQFTMGFVYMFTSLLTIAVVAVAILSLKHGLAAYEADKERQFKGDRNGEGLIAGSTLTLVLSVIILMIFATKTGLGIVYLINPEYYAIQEILNLI